MNMKRRLQHLESLPRRPAAGDGADPAEKELQRLCNLPLPEQATNEERSHALALLQAAQQRLRAGSSNDDHVLDAVREYATSLHRKYSGMN